MSSINPKALATQNLSSNLGSSHNSQQFQSNNTASHQISNSLPHQKTMKDKTSNSSNLIISNNDNIYNQNKLTNNLQDRNQIHNRQAHSLSQHQQHNSQTLNNKQFHIVQLQQQEQLQHHHHSQEQQNHLSKLSSTYSESNNHESSSTNNDNNVQMHMRKKSLTQFKQHNNPLLSEKKNDPQQPQDDQALSVRQFLPLHQTNASRSNLNKAKSNNNIQAIQQVNKELNNVEVDQSQISLLLQVSESGELNLKNQKINVIPKSIYSIRFDNVQILNIRGNELIRIEEELCKNLSQLRKLDARNNKIKEISPHIKAMMQLKVLRLDHNDLILLPNEIGDLQLLSELSFSHNKITQIPLSIQKLRQLKLLNIAENNIKHLPQEIGELRELKQLYLHGNKFTNFPCSFINFVHCLEELSLEWFMYARPPKPTLVKRNTTEGQEIFEQLEVLCQLLQKHSMNECAFITFLENYCVNLLDINSKDNRQRTPLHNAAVKGDNGVLEGLLLGKANPNLLDKDNCTPLCLAIREDNFEAAVILINEKVDVNLGGGIFGSPLHLAVVKVEVWIVKKLIQSNADVNKADNEGNTPLHLVMTVFSKNPQKCASIAELLITNGAKVNIKNNDNWGPLHAAVRKGQEKGVQTIIRLNQILREKGLEQFDLNISGGAQQFTPLQLAAHGGYLQIVRDLIQAGADIFQRNLHNQLPRHCAKGNYILTKFLKLAEQVQSRRQYQSYQINNQYELLQNVTQKKQSSLQEGQSDNKSQIKRKVTIDQIAEEYSSNYDTFMNNIAQLKVMKAFTQIEIVKKSRQISETNYIQKQLFNNQGTPINLSHLTPTPTYQEASDFSSSLKSQDLSKSQLQKSITINPQDILKHDSKFTKLNLKAEEKKINLFYLKDLLIKDTTSQQDKLDALAKIKKNQFKQVFGSAMRSLLPEFDKINDVFIQREIIFCIQNSCQFTLLAPLKELAQNIKDEDLLEEIEDTIRSLELCASKPKSFNIRLLKSSMQQSFHHQHNNSENAIVKSSIVERNVDSGEKSRNINSFKMKGMSTLIGQGNSATIIKNQHPQFHHHGIRSAAGTPAAQSQASKKPKLLEGEDDQKILKSLQLVGHSNQQLGMTQPLKGPISKQNIGIKCLTPYNQNHKSSFSNNQSSDNQLQQFDDVGKIHSQHSITNSNSNHNSNNFSANNNHQSNQNQSQQNASKNQNTNQFHRKKLPLNKVNAQSNSHFSQSMKQTPANGPHHKIWQQNSDIMKNTQNNKKQIFSSSSDDFERASDDEVDEDQSPSLEYESKRGNSNLRLGIMNRTMGASQNNVTGQKQNSQRSSISIPAKK